MNHVIEGLIMYQRIKVIVFTMYFLFIIWSPIHSQIVTVTEDSSAFFLTTNILQICIKKNPWQILVTNQNKEIILQESQNQGLQFGSYHVTRVDSFQFLGQTTIVKRNPPRYHAEDEALISGESTCFYCSTTSGTQAVVYITFRNPWVFSVWLTVPGLVQNTREVFISSSDEHFFGLGGCWDAQSLDLKGLDVTMANRSGTPDQGAYIPFYISTKGYGILIDNYLDVHFDFIDPSNVEITAPPISGSEDGEGYFHGSSMLWYFYYGPDLFDVIERYTEHVSRPLLPPSWAVFAPWQWRNDNTEAGVYEDAMGMREAKIPCGLIWIDRPWATGGANMPPPFEWTPDLYPNGHQMFMDLQDMGYKTGVWVSKVLYGDLDDSTLVLQLKQDSQNWMIQDNCQMYKIDRGNIQRMDPYFTCQAYYESWNEMFHGDFVTLPRVIAYRGQKYVSGLWPGDNDNTYNYPSGLKANIAVMLNLAIAGFPFYGSETGGFPDPPGNNVTIRWAQFSSFCPIFETAGTPYTYSTYYRDIFRKYSELYTRLFPYRWSYTRTAHEKGHPITRALVLEYPDDPAGYNEKFEYLFGEWILVAPIISGGSSRSVYLPPGEWIDWWDGKRYNGGKSFSDYSATEEKIPLFVKAGAIIPMIEIQQTWQHSSVDPMTLKIYPNGETSFHIKGDEIVYPGQSQPYTDLKEVLITCNELSNRLDIQIGDSDYSYLLEIHQAWSVDSVIHNGKVMRMLQNLDSLNAVEEGWVSESRAGGIQSVKIKGSNMTSHSVTVFYSRISGLRNRYDSQLTFALKQIYPNPFNSMTHVTYEVPKYTHVNLTIYSLLGERIETLVNQHKQTGIYEVTWNASGQSSGIYFVYMQCADYKKMKKIILLK